MTDLAYRDIEREIVGVLPELRSAAEYYWRVEGTPGSDSGAYVFFESMFGAYVTILLALPNSPRRDRMLQRAFDLVETMLARGDGEVRNLAFIGLLESRGAWWWQRAQPFMGPSARSALDSHEPGWVGETTGSTAGEPEFIDLYGVRPIIAHEPAEEGISLDQVPGATYTREAN
jgi:hypothetical protein